MLPSAFWLIALIVLLVGEAITIGLTFVWFAVGALGALIVSVLGGALWLQVVIFLALSGVTLALARHQRRPGHRPDRRGDRADRQPQRNRPGECGRADMVGPQRPRCGHPP